MKRMIFNRQCVLFSYQTSCDNDSISLNEGNALLTTDWQGLDEEQDTSDEEQDTSDEEEDTTDEEEDTSDKEQGTSETKECPDDGMTKFKLFQYY